VVLVLLFGQYLKVFGNNIKYLAVISYTLEKK